jgi:hypothetical protein
MNMVNLRNPEVVIQNGQIQPIMFKHALTAKKDTRSFKLGDTALCFITTMSDGRFAVMDASFKHPTIHYEVFTKEELHASFDEGVVHAEN